MHPSFAAAACYTGDPWGIITSFGARVQSTLPMGCVLILAATGSEMNPTSVITRASSKALNGLLVFWAIGQFISLGRS